MTKAALGSAGPVLTVGADEVPLDRVGAVVHQPPAAATKAPATEPTDDSTPTPATTQA